MFRMRTFGSDDDESNEVAKSTGTIGGELLIVPHRQPTPYYYPLGQQTS